MAQTTSEGRPLHDRPLVVLLFLGLTALLLADVIALGLLRSEVIAEGIPNAGDEFSETTTAYVDLVRVGWFLVAPTAAAAITFATIATDSSSKLIATLGTISPFVVMILVILVLIAGSLWLGLGW